MHIMGHQLKNTSLPLFLVISLFTMFGNAFGQVNEVHNIIRNQNIVIKHKISNNVWQVKGGTSIPNTQVGQFEYTGAPSQQFKLVDADNGNFFILSKDNLFLSLRFDTQISVGSSPTATGSRVLVHDNKYTQKPACEITDIANCPKHQIWKIKPVANESQTFTIESVAFNNMTLQPLSNASGVSVSLRNSTSEENSKWFIVGKDDLLLAPLATQAEITEFNDIEDNQFGIAVLSGDTTQPFYYHHNRPNEKIYKYSKRVHMAGPTTIGGIPNPTARQTSIEAWFPVQEHRQTFCGRVKAYKQCPQDLLHDGTFNLDIDALIHIIPNGKFSHMLKNPRMESYANGPDGQYFKQRLALWCQVQGFQGCFNEGMKKRAEEQAKKDVKELLEGFAQDNIEAEFTPAMLGNSTDVPDKHFKSPLNPMFKFAPINMGRSVCAYGPWMWERILVSDWPIIGLFKDSFFNNEIHPVNQIWFRENNTLNLIAVVDQTGYFEVPKNPSNKTEVHASGLNQRMRFHVGFKIPTNILNSDTNRAIEYQINAKGFKFNNMPENPVDEIVLLLKYKDTLRLTIRDNSFLKFGKTHRVFLDKVKKRPDGSIQGYLVVETEPITRRGGSINVFVNKQ